MRKLPDQFFVLNLDAREYKPFDNATYEIQLLDSDGLARESVYLAETDESAEINGLEIPRAVIDAAKRQVKGKGDYVNQDGESVSPF